MTLKRYSKREKKVTEKGERWHSDSAVSWPDLLSKDQEFKPSNLHLLSHNDPGQTVHSHEPPSPSTTIGYQCKLGAKWTHALYITVAQHQKSRGISRCLVKGFRNEDQQRLAIPICFGL